MTNYPKYVTRYPKIHHVYLQHGPSAGLAFLDCLQRLTTSVSLHAGYNHSVGLDDCILGPVESLVARRIIEDRVEAAITTGAPPSEETSGVPYRMQEREQTLGHLITVRAESEAYVVDRVLRPRHRRFAAACDPEAAALRPSTMMDTNQIAILGMLGTKGSVSNLVQCTHALGQFCECRHVNRNIHANSHTCHNQQWRVVATVGIIISQIVVFHDDWNKVE